MQARRAARELALILFSQFDKEITKYSRKDLSLVECMPQMGKIQSMQK